VVIKEQLFLKITCQISRM